MSAPPPTGDSAEEWRQRLSGDPTAIVALADHLLRTCGLALRLGNAVDPAPLFEMQLGLQGIPGGGPGDEPLKRAQALLDGGALALSGVPSCAKVSVNDLPALLGELRTALDRGDEPLARQSAPPILAAMVQTQTLPELPEIPDSGTLSSWIDAAMRMRQSRW